MTGYRRTLWYSAMVMVASAAGILPMAPLCRLCLAYSVQQRMDGLTSRSGVLKFDIGPDSRVYFFHDRDRLHQSFHR